MPWEGASTPSNSRIAPLVQLKPSSAQLAPIGWRHPPYQLAHSLKLLSQSLWTPPDRIAIRQLVFRRSSAVEQLTVNQLVVGSIPTAGANFPHFYDKSK